MIIELGVILAFIAMLCWGFGDFLEQKSTRGLGIWETLFFITFIGAVFLTPFVYKDIPGILKGNLSDLLLLGVTAIVYLIAALLDLESLRVGKLSVVEPLWSVEIPVATFAAFFIINEKVTLMQAGLIIFLLIGLVLVSLRSHHFEKKSWLERGAFIALAAGFTMGFANFLIGLSSRATNPLLAKWFFDVCFAVISLGMLIANRETKKSLKNFRTHKKFLFSMGILDNAAWLTFGFALVLDPIAIAVAISESYIIITVLLGMYVNKEKLRYHQKIGLVLAIIAVITLATTLG